MHGAGVRDRHQGRTRTFRAKPAGHSAIDSFTGRFTMLPDKLASMKAARDQLAASVTSTPRLITRVRGKALHYGCAIPFVVIAALPLSQLMHIRERAQAR